MAPSQTERLPENHTQNNAPLPMLTLGESTQNYKHKCRYTFSMWCLHYFSFPVTSMVQAQWPVKSQATYAATNLLALQEYRSLLGKFSSTTKAASTLKTMTSLSRLPLLLSAQKLRQQVGFRDGADASVQPKKGLSCSNDSVT